MDVKEPIQTGKIELLVPKIEPNDFVMIKTENCEDELDRCFVVSGIIETSSDVDHSIKKEKTEDTLTDSSSSSLVSQPIRVEYIFFMIKRLSTHI